MKIINSHRMCAVIILSMFYFSTGIAVSGSINKCVDSKGKVFYQEKECPTHQEKKIVKLDSGRQFTGELMDMHFPDGEYGLKELLVIFEDFSGKNIDYRSSRNPRVKYVGNNLPWDQVLYEICSRNGLHMKISNNQLIIY